MWAKCQAGMSLLMMYINGSIHLHGSVPVFSCWTFGPGSTSKWREEIWLLDWTSWYFAFSVLNSKNQYTDLHLNAVSDGSEFDKEIKSPHKVQTVLQHYLRVLHSAWKKRSGKAGDASPCNAHCCLQTWHTAGWKGNPRAIWFAVRLRSAGDEQCWHSELSYRVQVHGCSPFLPDLFFCSTFLRSIAQI